MTGLLLRPPLGPLAWLFPELLGDGDDDDRARLQAVCGAAERLRRDARARAAVEPGPRGHALAAVLRDQARDPWQQVPRVDPTPAPPSFEGAIVDAARRFPGAAWEVAMQDGACVVEAAPLTRARARDRARAWVLPLAPDASGAATAAAALEAVARDPEAFAAAGLVPLVLPPAAPDPGGRARVAGTWFGLGSDATPAVREAHRALVARLYPERALELDGYDSLAISGCDLYTASLRAALGVDTPPPAPPPHAAILGVCGIDGSGKSTHVQALAERLRARGLRVSTQKIYRHGIFHVTVTELTRRTAGGCNLHLWRMERLAKVFDSVKCYFGRVQAELDAHDVVIFDRYVQTHYAAGAGRCHWDPFTRELLAVYPRADLVFFLDVPVATALARIGERTQRTVDENPYMLGRYRAMFTALSGGEMIRLDGSAPFADNHAAMCRAIDALLGGRRRSGS